MDEFFATQTEQHLTARGVATMTKMGVPNPPEMSLILDVTHDETNHAWRQEVKLNREQMIEMTQLLVYSCHQVDLDWRPNDAHDFTPDDDDA